MTPMPSSLAMSPAFGPRRRDDLRSLRARGRLAAAELAGCARLGDALSLSLQHDRALEFCDRAEDADHELVCGRRCIDAHGECPQRHRLRYELVDAPPPTKGHR